MPSAPGALFGEAVRTVFSISGMVMSGHLIGGGYSYPLMSEEVCSGWRRKEGLAQYLSLLLRLVN